MRDRPLATVGAEETFIRLCVQELDTVDGAQLVAAAAAVTDWPAVVATAASHRVAAYVQHTVRTRGLAVDPAAMRQLEGATLLLTAQVMQLNHALSQVVAAMDSAALPVIILKGPVLARTIYPRPAFRPYGDLDLTVRVEHEPFAAQVLLASGYQEQPYEAEEARQAHGSHGPHEAAYHRIFFQPERQVVVELHTDPLQLGLAPVCEEDRWARAHPVEGLPGALMLAVEDQLVQLSVHAHKHGFSRLIWLKDLDLLVRRYAATLDWDLVVTVARQEGVLPSVWYTLRLTRELLGAPVPEPVLRRLAPSAVRRGLYALIWPAARITRLAGFMRRRAVQFHAAEAWQGTIPSLLLMGRTRVRARSLLQSAFARPRH